MISVQHNRRSVTTKAVEYKGTPESLAEVIQLPGVTHATAVVHSDGATVLAIQNRLGINLVTVAAGDYVTCSQGEYPGDVYTPGDFRRLFTPVPSN